MLIANNTGCSSYYDEICVTMGGVGCGVGRDNHTNVVVVFKKRCGCCQEQCSTPRMKKWLPKPISARDKGGEVNGLLWRYVYQWWL